MTDAVWDELEEWRNRPLDSMYPIVYIDASDRSRSVTALWRTVPPISQSVSTSTAANTCWGSGSATAKGEGSKFWLSVLSELKNRGVDDVLIVVCDGLTGLPDAIEAVWPRRRRSRRVLCTCCEARSGMRHIKTARRLAAVPAADLHRPLGRRCPRSDWNVFEDEWGTRYPAIVIRLWRNSWDVFVSVPGVSASEIRRVVYTTNMIESINYQLRKVDAAH